MCHVREGVKHHISNALLLSCALFPCGRVVQERKVQSDTVATSPAACHDDSNIFARYYLQLRDTRNYSRVGNGFTDGVEDNDATHFLLKNCSTSSSQSSYSANLCRCIDPVVLMECKYLQCHFEWAYYCNFIEYTIACMLLLSMVGVSSSSYNTYSSSQACNNF